MPSKFLTPTKIAVGTRCSHTWYLECFGDPSEKLQPDDGLKMIWERGQEHERQVIAKLPSYVTPEWERSDWKAGHKATVQCMQQGKPWIYQGPLLGTGLRGVPDLLQRVEGSSKLGEYSYIPVDIKGHKAVTKKDRYQLQAYANLLEPVLGTRPLKGGIWLNTNRIEEVDLAREKAEFIALVQDLERIGRGDLVTKGYRCGECQTCPWLTHCRGEWERSRHVCQLYGVTGDIARRYEEAGFGSWEKVAAATAAEVASALGIDLERAERAQLFAKARSTGRPQVRKPATFPKGVPIHFYDIETYEGVTYLHGNVRVFNGKREEVQFVARKPEDEGKAWHEFLDFLARDKKALVYDWADYERGFAHSLWEKHGGNPKGWKHLKDNLVDQCAFVREHFALPLSSYSIKAVAPLFGFSWRHEDAGGLNSESWYGDWLKTGDEKILEKILGYNLDDVLAMEAIHNALKRETTAA